MDKTVNHISARLSISRLGSFLSAILVMHAFVAVCLYFQYSWSLPEYLLPYLLVSVFVFTVTCIYYMNHFFFLIRMVFIGCMGIIPMSAIYFGGLFSFRGVFSQTPEIGFMMLLMSNMALMSAHFGFVLSRRIKVTDFDKVNNHSLVIVLSVFILTLLVSYLIGQMRGGFIFDAGYGSADRGGEDMPIHNLNVIGRLGVYFLFFYYSVAKYKGSINQRLYLFLVVVSSLYLIIWNEFLRGARMDPLTEIVALMVLVRVYTTEKINLSVKYIILFFLLFLVIQAWGYLRSAIANGIDVDLLLGSFTLDSKTSSSGAVVLFFQGTLNNLYVTISTTMHAVQNDLITHWHGQSYVDFILRTPPAFLYPERPGSLAWLPVMIYGKGATGGGFTELAEIFLNFGALGALFVPGVISLGIGLSLKLLIKNKYSLLCAIPVMSFMSVYFRGNLYQTFVFYKALITGLILFALLNILSQLMSGSWKWKP